MKTTDALEAIEGILQACHIVFPDYRTRYIASELISKYDISSDRIFDAYLTATALSNRITVIATDNVSDFKRFTEVQILNPF
jgi:predicted nucleic acid-binding protein